MAGTDQSDDQEMEMQTDLFGAEPVPAYRPDPEKVRARLHKILAEARAARTLPVPTLAQSSEHADAEPPHVRADLALGFAHRGPHRQCDSVHITGAHDGNT
jgi:hypothetical protein